MFDIGFWELALIGVIALLVVGPERLPALARNVGLWVGRMRRYVAHVKDDIEREIHAEEVRKLIETPAHSISEFDDAISETKSVFKEAERQLSEVEHEAESLEKEMTQDLGAAEAGLTELSADEPADALAEKPAEDGPFAPANSQSLSPAEAVSGAEDKPAEPAAVQPVPESDGEQRHAKS